MLASKIPALELELLLDSIDAEATRIIEPYQGARFAISMRDAEHWEGMGVVALILTHGLERKR